MSVHMCAHCSCVWVCVCVCHLQCWRVVHINYEKSLWTACNLVGKESVSKCLQFASIYSFSVSPVCARVYTIWLWLIPPFLYISSISIYNFAYAFLNCQFLFSIADWSLSTWNTMNRIWNIFTLALIAWLTKCGK